MCIEYKMEVTRNKIVAMVLVGVIVILLRFIPMEFRSWFENRDGSPDLSVNMDVTTSKIVAMSLLGGISVMLGFIPLKLGGIFTNSAGNSRHDAIFSCLLCFGGGVLLATSLLHMLPEVKYNF